MGDLTSKVPCGGDDDAVPASLRPAQAGECKQEAVVMKIEVLEGSTAR